MKLDGETMSFTYNKLNQLKSTTPAMGDNKQPNVMNIVYMSKSVIHRDLMKH